MKRIHTKRPRQERLQKSLAITTVLLGMLFASSAWAGDHHMVVEGLLKDDAGAALNGQYQITVKLYADKDSEGDVWSETLDAVSVN